MFTNNVCSKKLPKASHKCAHTFIKKKSSNSFVIGQYDNNNIKNAHSK